MKIRKTEPSVGILGKIVNLFSNSTKDTYSCDYINQSQESLETAITTLTESINKAKKVVLTGQWVNAVAAFAGVAGFCAAEGEIPYSEFPREPSRYVAQDTREA